MSDFSFTARTTKASPQLFLQLRAGQAHQAGDPDGSQGRRLAAGVPEDQAERRARLLLCARLRRGRERAARLRSRSTSSSSRTTTRRRRRTAPSTPRCTPAGTCRRTSRSEAAARPAGGPHAQRDCGRSSRLPATRAPGSRGACTRRGEPIFTHVDLEVYRRRLAAVPDGLSALISLLLLGDPVPAGRAGGAAGRGGPRRGARRVAARARARRPPRRPPDRLRPARRRRRGPRRGRPPPLGRPRAPHDQGAGRAGARRLHGERDPGAPALPPRGARRRDGRERGERWHSQPSTSP